MIWFTADHHFGHENIIKYTNRPYGSAREMDDDLIRRWNDRIHPKDTVYYLGDFTLGNDAFKYIQQLNGQRIYFVYGGHDWRWWESGASIPRCRFLQPLETIDLGGHIIVLCHYPLLSWDRSHYGTWHLHGHIHSVDGRSFPSADRQLPPKSRGGTNGLRLDVGVDAHNYYPLALDEIEGLMLPRNDTENADEN